MYTAHKAYIKPKFRGIIEVTCLKGQSLNIWVPADFNRLSTDFNRKKRLKVDHTFDYQIQQQSNTFFLRGNIGDCPTHIKSSCYGTLVRPILEYGSAIWDPHHKNDISKFEKIQKRAARFVTGNYQLEQGNTKANMQQLMWKPLEERRAVAKLNLFFKGKRIFALVQQLIEGTVDFWSQIIEGMVDF